MWKTVNVEYLGNQMCSDKNNSSFDIGHMRYTRKTLSGGLDVRV